MNLSKALNQFNSQPSWIRRHWTTLMIPKTLIIQYKNDSRLLTFSKLEQVYPRVARALSCPDIRVIGWRQGKHWIVVQRGNDMDESIFTDV